MFLTQNFDAVSFFNEQATAASNQKGLLKKLFANVIAVIVMKLALINHCEWLFEAHTDLRQIAHCTIYSINVFFTYIIESSNFFV